MLDRVANSGDTLSDLNDNSARIWAGETGVTVCKGSWDVLLGCIFERQAIWRNDIPAGPECDLCMRVSVGYVCSNGSRDTRQLVFTRGQDATWRGPWGRCMGSDCGPGGSQSRAVWCAHVEGWTTLPTNCQQSSRPANQRSCFRVCDWHRDLYDWRIGSWNRCLPVEEYSGGSGHCLHAEAGVQTREVSCMLRADSSPADDSICEYFEPRPRLEQACLIPCPRDCVVSQFSPWTSCSKTCGLGLQNRARSVLAPPLFGGMLCPNLTEFRTCAPKHCDGREMVFNLRLGSWSDCDPLPVVPLMSSVSPPRVRRQARRRKGKERQGARDPETRELIKSKRNRNKLNRQENSMWGMELGYQVRQVVCVHRNGSTVSVSQCPHWSLPDLHRPCLMPKDCVVGEWTEWTPCSKTCFDPETPKGVRTRGRDIQQLPVGGGAQCPLLEEKQPCEPVGDGVPSCAMYTWRITEWAECRVDVLLSQQDRRRSNQTWLCGGGMQTRVVYCSRVNVDQTSDPNASPDKPAPQPVDSQLCIGPVPSTNQLCHIPCPVEWFKFRRRKITNFPTGGEGSCAHLVEALRVCPATRAQLLQLAATRLGAVSPCRGGRRVRDRNPWTSWSTCSQTCSSKTADGRQTRTRAILAFSAREGGSSCPNASTLQEMRSCNDHLCVVYHWQTGPWGPCTEETSVTVLNSTRATSSGQGKTSCTTGMQTRKVICIKVNVGQVPPKKKDCAVTEFSEWTACPASCEAGLIPAVEMASGAERSVKFHSVHVTLLVSGFAAQNNQSRFRLITQKPTNGGVECPETLYEERECEIQPGPASLCPGYRWKTHKWRRCQLVPWSIRQDTRGAQEGCGAGLQTRAVSCRQLDGSIADIAQCLKFASSMPIVHQLCQMPCRDDCQLTNWSKFSSCSANCVGVRTRKRALMGKSKKKDKCRNSQTYPLSETQYCPCDKYNAQPVGNWSDCILPEGSVFTPGTRVHGDSRECGQGYRYQAMVCYDQDNRLVETSRCNSHGYIEEACIIPCPSDCKLSEWSNWSRCSKSCGSGVKVRSKWLREKPYNGGRPCPKLDHVNQVYEVVPCVSDCSQYVWVAEPWSTWKVSNVDLKENCGDGVQTRKVRCMLNTVNGPTDVVEDYLCDPEDIPAGTQESRLPCPDQCVLSEWSSWTDCQMLGLERTWQMNASCTVECPVNCQLSEWSVWTDCSQTCGLDGDCYLMEWSDWSLCQSVCVKGQRVELSAVQVRSRAAVAQEPENIGQCPNQEWQSRRCADGECFDYKWVSSLRSVWCERSDGTNVTGGCPPTVAPGTEQLCVPPCDRPRSSCSEEAVCVCEEGYTEVLSTDGLLQHCAQIPVLEIPTAGSKDEDVKTSRAVDSTASTTGQPGHTGRTWYLKPFGPDGRLKTWVYGVAAGVLVLLVFIVSMVYLACSYCAMRRSRATFDSASCAAVWMGRDAHELTFTYPEYQHPEASDDSLTLYPLVFLTAQVKGHTDLQQGDESYIQTSTAHPDLLENWFMDYTSLHPANQQTKRRSASNVKPGKLRKMFGWGDFHCNVKSTSLDLLIKGKIVDHGNGTFSIHFVCNSTGVGNVTIGLVPSSRPVEFGLPQDEVKESVDSKLFNCRVESEEVKQSKSSVRCSYDPSLSCEHQHTHSHVAWLCSKPVKVICVYVSYRSLDYNLLQKICPDYNHHSDAPYVSSG
ncbi:Thrombospondin type-1 domain-containing protein 7A [Bagarius yarrelli]|uniref:Thrombospondin type-1 domain-containing protein 7A n=1 Tax=Bagarius yarrelli TaxID=175774 RepID=A0A556TLT3_BAGYA|nr:Thrombospondin type-1 domain-containing protein 7A [Bagarius yarrelli]